MNEENKESQGKEEKGPTETPTLRCGYTVGLTEEGQLHFQVLGDEVGLAQLLGLHAYSDYRVKHLVDTNQGYGVPLLAQQNHQMAELLKQIVHMLNTMVSHQLQTPENKLIHLP